jgi:hypothetical protein
MTPNALCSSCGKPMAEHVNASPSCAEGMRADAAGRVLDAAVRLRESLRDHVTRGRIQCRDCVANWRELDAALEALRAAKKETPDA